jgi:hypothetical protein
MVLWIAEHVNPLQDAILVFLTMQDAMTDFMGQRKALTCRRVVLVQVNPATFLLKVDATTDGAVLEVA